jgi:hypothetical protein
MYYKRKTADVNCGTRVTSAVTTTMSDPNFCFASTATASSSVFVRARIATRAPSSAHRSAIARPMPRPAPQDFSRTEGKKEREREAEAAAKGREAHLAFGEVCVVGVCGRFVVDSHLRQSRAHGGPAGDPT